MTPADTAAIRESDPAREKVAAWMIAHSFATGHGDTLDDLLGELSAHVLEIRVLATRTERERCVKLVRAIAGFDAADAVARAIEADHD